jgi:putative PEP-CTERM system histidine kinase
VSDFVGTAIFGLCSATYLILFVLSMLARTSALKGWHFAVPCLITAVWSLSAADLPGLSTPVGLQDAVELVRNGGWMFFLLTLWRIDARAGVSSRRVLASRALAPIALILVVVLLPYLYNLRSAIRSALIVVSLLNIILPVICLLLIENLLRTGGTPGRWEIKHLCLGLGTLMTFTFFVHSDLLLQGGINQTFAEAHGLITIFVAPLLYSSFHRLQNWQYRPEVRITASPKPALYTVALVGSGSYLLLMAALSYYLHDIGGRWGLTLQISLMVAALLVMFVSLTSTQIKSHIKVLILKNFFTYRYDYREEWLKFIQMMSAAQPSSMEIRIVRAIADLMNSPAGGLWILQRQDDCFFVDAVWNLAGPHPPVRMDSPLIGFFRRTCRIIDVEEYRKHPERYGDLLLPEWITDRSTVWLIVPLLHRNDILGFMVIDHARARHPLDWEDRDLLSTATIQAASYLAEEMTAEELRSARRLEDFNRQFAFVVHDIKNVVGQMSLMLENAKKFGDNPEFQKDMLETVDNSVGRMRALLEQLSAQRRQAPTARTLELVAILEKVLTHWRKTATNISLQVPTRPVLAVAVEPTLISVLDLLVDNALSAAGPNGSVELRLRIDADRPIIEVADNGPGMDETFVNKELFRPLASTKSNGFGIGAYQTRHLVREMGAQLEVETAPQKGTTMRIVLPRGDMATPTSAPESTRESSQG